MQSDDIISPESLNFSLSEKPDGQFTIDTTRINRRYSSIVGVNTPYGTLGNNKVYVDRAKELGVGLKLGNVDHGYVGAVSDVGVQGPSGYNVQGDAIYYPPSNTIWSADTSLSKTAGSYTFFNGIKPTFKSTHSIT